MTPRNFSTAVVYRYTWCPYLVVLKTHDNLATRPFDYSEVAQDGSTATSVDLSALPALADGGEVWVGSKVRFRGAHIDVDAANGTANNLTVHYPTAGSLTLTDISDTDNTDTGASLAVDGTVTWTVPAAWTLATLREIANANSLDISSASFRYADEKMFWTRWSWNVAMDAATTLDHLLGLNESTAYAEEVVGVASAERVHVGLGLNGISGIEALTDAGTGNILLNCYSLQGYFSTGTVSVA